MPFSLNTYNLKLYLCHTNTVFLHMAKSGWGIFLVQKYQQCLQSHISWSVPSRKSTKMVQWLKSRRAGGECQLSLLLMWTWNKSLLHILVSSDHQIIITSYLVLLHISKTLIYHCCIATSAKITVGKQFPAKSIRRRKMC